MKYAGASKVCNTFLQRYHSYKICENQPNIKKLKHGLDILQPGNIPGYLYILSSSLGLPQCFIIISITTRNFDTKYFTSANYLKSLQNTKYRICWLCSKTQEKNWTTCISVFMIPLWKIWLQNYQWLWNQTLKTQLGVNFLHILYTEQTLLTTSSHHRNRTGTISTVGG